MGDNLVIAKKVGITLGIVGVVSLLGWGISMIPLVGYGISKLPLFGCVVAKIVNGCYNLIEWGVSKVVKVGSKKMMKAPGTENYYICRDVFESDPANYFRSLRN